MTTISNTTLTLIDVTSVALVVVDSGAIVVSSGGVASGSIISSGGHQNVSSGGSAVSTVIDFDGQENILSGGHAIGVIVSSGGSEAIDSGGIGSNGVVSAHGVEVVQGSAISTIVESGGIFEILSAGSATGTVVSGAELVVGVAIGTVVSSGGSETVLAGGQAEGTTVLSGGSQNISSGGVASGTTVAGNELDSGTTSNSVISSGGSETVFSGAVAVSTLVSNGGFLAVSSGGNASGSIVSSGGHVMLPLTTALGSTWNSAGTNVVDGVTIQAGALVNLVISSGGVITGFVDSAGSALEGSDDILSGGSAVSTIVLAAIGEDVFSGGHATGAVVSSGGEQQVRGGGVASDTVVSALGELLIQTGGSASGSVILSGGFVNLILSSAQGQWNAAGSNVVEGVTIDSAAVAIITAGSGGSLSGFVASNRAEDAAISGGVLSGSLIEAGGEEFIFAGGIASGTLISGGSQLMFGGSAVDNVIDFGTQEMIGGSAISTVISGVGADQLIIVGSAIGTVIENGGEQAVDGGTASGTVVSSGGLQSVDGGSALATVISSGGSAFVATGAHASGTIVESGGVFELMSGASSTVSATVLSVGGEIDITGIDGVSASSSGGNIVISLSGGGTYVLAMSGLNDPTIEISASTSQTDIALGPLTPVIAAPATATLIVSQTSAISGVSLSETGSTFNETFTVTIGDTDGQLNATGAGTGTSLTLTGSLAQIDAELATLTDTDDVAGSDTITLTARDGYGNSATPQTIVVTVGGQPVVSGPTGVTVGVTKTAAISGVSLSEIGATATETFTLALQDATGILTAPGTAGAISGSGTTSLTISGSLSEVNADLATLQDTDGTAGTDTISINATDSNGVSGQTDTIAVTVNGVPVISAPASVVVGEGAQSPVGGVTLSESGNTASESFTVVLGDGTGLLSAMGASGTGSTSLTIAGSLSQVNSALATLTDEESALGSDTITLTAADSFGNITSAPTQIDVSVNPPPVISAPQSATVGAGRSSPVPGISISETGAAATESFTVVLSDAAGTFSASGGGSITGTGTTSLTIAGSLSQVNADLATLVDTDGSSANTSAGSDTITVHASDSLNNSAQNETIAVTINGRPVIAAPAAVTVGQGESSPVAGVSISESGNTAGETFTVVLTDADGALSASGAVAGSATTSLTIAGSLSEVNADLATLNDDDGVTPSDTITITASDSFGNSAVQQTIAVTVAPPPVVTAPSAATVGVNQPGAISGVSVAETGASATETFTVVLTDGTGALAAASGVIAGAGTTSLTIAGTLSDVNNELATLTDTDATSGLDTIAITATDSFGNVTSGATIVDVTVNGPPVITLPGSLTAGVGQQFHISGVSISETGNTTTETFTVTVSDSLGTLDAIDAIPGSEITITGNLGQINSELATLVDTDSSAGPDTISVTATDSFGNSDSESIDVTVNGPPVVDAPPTAVVGLGRTGAIGGVSVSETGNTATETFTVALTDTNGILSLSGGGSGATSLTIAGSLSEVSAELATLTDTDSVLATDTITVTATDSFDNTGSSTITVTVGEPIVSAPPETIGTGRNSPLVGVSLGEAGATATETFTVVLSDATGRLSARGRTVAGSGTTSLTISGTLSQVNAELATLKDEDSPPGAATITAVATDSFGLTGPATLIAVTINGVPVISAPASETVGENRATPIGGISISESGDTTTSGEVFTVTVADDRGRLTALGSGILGNGSPSLILTGTLSQVNAELATLSDTEPGLAPDTITVSATDSFGNVAQPRQTIALAVEGPRVATPVLATLRDGQTGSLGGVRIFESGAVGGNFTVTVSDATGDLSASGAGVSGSGTSLTIIGSLSQANADLATLKDTAGSSDDIVRVQAVDSLGDTASGEIAVLVDGVPQIAAPGSEALVAGRRTAIPGVKLSETGAVTGETFTVTVTDSNGILTASGAGVSGSGTTHLVISGSLSQVNKDLATLADTDRVLPSDVITVAATDSFGVGATPAVVAVTVNSPTRGAVVPIHAETLHAGGLGFLGRGSGGGGSATPSIVPPGQGGLKLPLGSSPAGDLTHLGGLLHGAGAYRHDHSHANSGGIASWLQKGRAQGMAPADRHGHAKPGINDPAQDIALPTL
jgi:autotransporter passenger strand-loop-strand repeat protein